MIPKVLSPACVWMRAGVIRFWLCDRDFDCENCPLDAALRAHRPTHLPTLDDVQLPGNPSPGCPRPADGDPHRR